MSPIWTPSTNRIQEELEKEKAKSALIQDELKQRFIPSWTPPVQNLAAPESGTIPQIDTPTPQVERNFVPQSMQLDNTTQEVYTPELQYRTQPMVEDITEPQPVVSQSVAPNDTTLWYEQPKALYEKAETGIAKAVSKVPLLPKALDKVAPVFEWVSNNLDKPFAATILSAFSPSLSWKQGESWLSHEKREYEEWKAPTYVKGVAEFANPLWWIPWVGWAGKGAKALGMGGKIAEVAAKTAQASGKLGQVTLPESKVLDNALFKLNPSKKLALWAENKPVLHNIVKAVGGESAFARAPEIGESALDTTRRAIIKRFTVFDMRKGVSGQLMPKLLKHGNIEKKLQIDDMGRVLSATPIGEEGARLGRGISEVIEHPELYKFATPEAKQIVTDTRDILTEVFRLTKSEGINLPKDIFYHRIVKGKTVLDPKMKPHFEESEFGSLFEKSRTYQTMEQAITENAKKGMKLQYGTSIRESLESTINHYMKRIADKRFTDDIKGLGKTALERFTAAEPVIAEKITANAAKLTASKYALNAVTKLKSYRGTSIPGATLEKIRNELPDIANQIDNMFDLPKNDVLKIITNLSSELYRTTRLSPKDARILISQYEGKNMIQKMVAMLEDKTIDNNLSKDMIEKIYKNAYEIKKQTIDDAIDDIQKVTKGLLESTTAELKPLKATRSEFLKHFKGKDILADPINGERLAMFRRNPPAFRDKFFDDDVVKFVEKIEGDKSQDWLRAAANISGMSRMFTATLDFSAPFIQGLNVLGRNPVAWAKAVLKQYEFAINPTNFYKYMDDPVTKAIIADRVTAGASISSFEFFEAMKPLQKGKLAPIIQQTFGRAEAAFTGFGEVARNEMWKALRRPDMQPEQLRELARITDRMTGVMSSEGIGIGRTQQDFENAFVFFAPRYTRASLSFVSDVFKGGMTGAEVRKSLGGLMAGGMAMYIGTCKALEQQPNLDPTSGRFLTVKVGEQYVGLGGIMYSLMRFGYSVAATAADPEKRLDLVSLSRFDNPFIKFMYGRTSPLTGTVNNIIESKNYLGEPLESPADWGRFMVEKITPIALQTTIESATQKGEIDPLVFLAEEAGGRTFPQSAWEYREQARDKHAMEKYGKSYGDLPVLYQKMIDSEPDVQMFSQEADERQAIRGGLSAKFVQWQDERDSARQMYVDRLSQLQRAYDDGMIDGMTFKDELQNAGYGLGVTYNHINGQKEYSEVMGKLNQPKEISSKYRGDVAYEELTAASYSNQFTDEYGIFDFDGYNAFRESLQQKYSDVWDYVTQREAQTKADLPPLAQEYQRAKEILRPYWDITTDVVNLFGQRFADSPRGKSLIKKRKENLRRMNPEIDKYITMFYTQG
jgi:hypothetical protein